VVVILEHISQQPPREIVFTTQFDINDIGISAANRRLLEQIEAVMGDIDANFKSLYHYISEGESIARAWQHFEVTAAMLESSDDPTGTPVVRSVLTTASSSNHEFNWMLAGGVSPHYAVVLGPGRGVPSHPVTIDREDANIKARKWNTTAGVPGHEPETVSRPYGMTGLKLQFGQWKPHATLPKYEFWPSSIAVGTWIYLEQVLPVVKIL